MRLLTAIALLLVSSASVIAQAPLPDYIILAVNQPHKNGGIRFEFFEYADPGGSHGVRRTAQVDGILGSMTPKQKAEHIYFELTAQLPGITIILFGEDILHIKGPVGIACTYCNDTTAEAMELLNIDNDRNGTIDRVNILHSDRYQNSFRLDGNAMGGSLSYGENGLVATVQTHPGMSLSAIYMQFELALGGTATEQGFFLPETSGGARSVTFDVADLGLDITTTFDMKGEGQPSSPVDGSLCVNSSFSLSGFHPSDGREGPYSSQIWAGDEMIDFHLTGPPNQPIVLLMGDMNVGAASFGPYGQLDIGSLDPAVGSMGVQVVASGADPGSFNSQWMTDASGFVTNVYPSTPSLGGLVAGFQAAIFRPAGGVRLTNAVAVYFL